MKNKTNSIDVNGLNVSFLNINKNEFISLTDIAKYKKPEAPADIIKNWLRSKNTIALLGLWEKLHNPDFKLVEFDQFRNEAGFNHFVLSPQKWIKNTRVYASEADVLNMALFGKTAKQWRNENPNTRAKSHNQKPRTKEQ